MEIKQSPVIIIISNEEVKDMVERWLRDQWRYSTPSRVEKYDSVLDFHKSMSDGSLIVSWGEKLEEAERSDKIPEVGTVPPELVDDLKQLATDMSQLQAEQGTPVIP